MKVIYPLHVREGTDHLLGLLGHGHDQGIVRDIVADGGADAADFLLPLELHRPGKLDEEAYGLAGTDAGRVETQFLRDIDPPLAGVEPACLQHYPVRFSHQFFRVNEVLGRPIRTGGGYHGQIVGGPALCRLRLPAVRLSLGDCGDFGCFLDRRRGRLRGNRETTVRRPLIARIACRRGRDALRHKRCIIRVNPHETHQQEK